MAASLDVEIRREGDVMSRLGDPVVAAAWNRLADGTAWASAYQTLAFVEAWYPLHEARFEPILVEGRRDGQLVAILPLARRRDGRLLVGAGDFHAEYQTWLADDEAGEAFMPAALAALARTFRRARLRLSFMPAATPLGWTSHRPWTGRVELRSRVRGVLDLTDPQAVAAPLRKSSNRSKLARLRRHGGVRLEVIPSVEALEAEFDTIAALCDLRQGALHGVLPFAGNPLKRPLHVELMRRGLLYPTVLRVGDEIASFHLDMRNRDEVLLCVVGHAPRFARESPGSLHIHLLAQHLAAEGLAGYDLSPGEGYKARFATRGDTVHRLVVDLDPVDAARRRVRTWVRSAGKAALAAVGQTPASAARAIDQARPAHLAGSLRRARHSLGTRRVVHVFRLEPRDAAADASPAELRPDRLADLVAYRPGGPADPTVRAFLADALARLERGDRSLTAVDEGGLRECWWLRRVGAMSPPGEPGQPSGDGPGRPPTPTLLEGSVLVGDPYVASRVGRRPTADVLAALRAAVAAVAPGAVCYLAVPEATLADAGSTRSADGWIGALVQASRFGHPRWRPVGFGEAGHELLVAEVASALRGLYPAATRQARRGT